MVTVMWITGCVVVLAVVGWVFWDRQQQRHSDSLDEAGRRGGAAEIEAVGRAYGLIGRHGASPPGVSVRLGRWLLGLLQRPDPDPHPAERPHADRDGGSGGARDDVSGRDET